MDILTSQFWSDYLSDEVRSRSDLDRLVERAELYTVDRYRESGGYSALSWNGNETVRLDGWATKADGTPDTEAMRDELVRALRLSIAALVEHWHEHEDTREVESISQGNESVTFRDRPRVPRHVFSTLRIYDERRLRL